MNAIEALKAARLAGLALRLDGRDLVVSAPAAPAAALLTGLTRHKRVIVELLHGGRSAEDWEDFYEERAAILEHDCGLPRRLAEARAVENCLTECRTPDTRIR